jgi:hypothetical protein
MTWYKTAEERHGQTAVKGRKGEELVIKLIKSWGYRVLDLEENRQQQVQDRDIAFKKEEWSRYYYGSVKTNIWNDCIVLEFKKNKGFNNIVDGWFVSHNPDRYFFVDLSTSRIIQCGSNQLKEFIKGKKYKLSQTRNNDTIMYVPIKDLKAMNDQHLCMEFR